MFPTEVFNRNKYSGSISNSIGYIQMGRPYLGLASITGRIGGQIKRPQLVFVVRIIDRKLYILWPNQTNTTRTSLRAAISIKTEEVSYQGDILG